MTDKESIRDEINYLKSKRIIKFDSEIAKDLGYSRGAVSEILSLNSTKPVTYAFAQKFKEKYGKYLRKQPPPDKLQVLEAEIKVLKQIVVSLSEQVTGKVPDTIIKEIDNAVKMVLK